MATKPNEAINGRYFYRWNTPEGQQALALANKALAAAGIDLQIYYDNGMVPGLLGDLTDEEKAHQKTAADGQLAAQRADNEEAARQQAVRDAIAAAEKKAADNGQ